MGFPGSSAGKESACNAGDPSSIPGSGRSPGEGRDYPLQYPCAFLVAQMVKNLPTIWETWVWSLGWEDPPWRQAWEPTLAWSGMAKKRSLASLVTKCFQHCDPIVWRPPGSSLHGIFQARILEWIAISYSITGVYLLYKCCVSVCYTAKPTGYTVFIYPPLFISFLFRSQECIV